MNKQEKLTVVFKDKKTLEPFLEVARMMVKTGNIPGKCFGDLIDEANKERAGGSDITEKIVGLGTTTHRFPFAYIELFTETSLTFRGGCSWGVMNDKFCVVKESGEEIAFFPQEDIEKFFVK